MVALRDLARSQGRGGIRNAIYFGDIGHLSEIFSKFVTGRSVKKCPTQRDILYGWPLRWLATNKYVSKSNLT